jgi:predicted ferric reductase
VALFDHTTYDNHFAIMPDMKHHHTHSNLHQMGRRDPANFPNLFDRTTIQRSTANASILPYTSGLDGVSLGLDRHLISWLWLSMIVLASLIFSVRIYQRIHSHMRRISAMSTSRSQQNYWAYDGSPTWPAFKKHILYAPLGKKRHNREIQLSKASNYGTIPSRLHLILLVLYVASNIAYCSILDYGRIEKAAIIAEVRGRTGILATANMVPLVLLAGRNNPAIPLLKVSFDSWNLFHRWIGRIVVVEAIAHTIAWGINNVDAKGLNGAFDSISGDPFLIFGVVGTVSMIVILIQTLSPIRHALYETFLHLHQMLALLAVLGIYAHLEIAKLPALPYIRAVVALWVSERALRFVRLLYLNLSRKNGATQVFVEALPGEACRVTFQLPRHVTIRPGSHVYAYLPNVSWWMSHPFSVAWTNPESEPPTGNKHVIPPTPVTCDVEKQFPRELPPRDLAKAPTSVSLVMVARTGMTRKLYDLATLGPEKTLRMAGYIEGPYAGHDSLASYGTVILFAGGAGITHHLIQTRHLLACSRARTVATRKITLVWSVRDVQQLAWVRPWMDEIMAMEGRRDVLTIVLYVTRSKSGHLTSPSNSVKLHVGRCDPGAVLDEELADRVGATVVSVCGPGAFADSVRFATRERMHVGVLDFMEEAFTW